MITLGADPELFFTKNGMFHSAYGHVPGTKDYPEPTSFGAVQLDGHAVEFNIHPTDNPDEFVYLLNEGVNYCRSLASKAGCAISFEPVAVFPSAHFDSLPLDTKVLGCSPDFNGITGEINQAPDIAESPIRTSSGHVHVGFPCPVEFWHGEGLAVRQAFVAHLGPILEAVAATWETEASIERRRYYGANYSFRPKPYGIELRQLDALWLTDERYMRLVFDAVYTNTVSFLNDYDQIKVEAA